MTSGSLLSSSSRSRFSATRKRVLSCRRWSATPRSSATSLTLTRRTSLHLRTCAGTFFALVCLSVISDFCGLPLTIAAGQVYHTLLQEREDKGINDVVISRVEQISPFPYDLVSTPRYDQMVDAVLMIPLRSRLTLTSTPTRTFSGARRSRLTTVHGAMSRLVSSPPQMRRSTTRASTRSTPAASLRAPSRLVARRCTRSRLSSSSRPRSPSKWTAWVESVIHDSSAFLLDAGHGAPSLLMCSSSVLVMI